MLASEIDGSAVRVRSSLSKMRAFISSASGRPVICSTMRPSSTVFVFEYAYAAPGAKSAGRERPIAMSSSGCHARPGSSSSARFTSSDSL